MSPGGFHSFEHRWALGEAFEFHLQIGKDKVAARIHELNRQCKTGLAAMKHVTLHTPIADEVSAGIITFDVAGMKPDDVVKRLHEKRIVASTTPIPEELRAARPGPAQLARASRDGATRDPRIRLSRGLRSRQTLPAMLTCVSWTSFCQKY